MSSFYLWLDFSSILSEFWENFRHNLFKPLLLFFYMGFLVPILRVKLDFPHVIYQGLVIYLLVSIGWKGGEELALLPKSEMRNALGFMVVGFFTNFVIGIVAYAILRVGTNLRRIDAATVAGYYGSDSAGTFVTCTGVLVSARIAYAAYMPVMLAVMEIPGCLVALFLVSKLRRSGIDALGNAPDEAGYDPQALPPSSESSDDDSGATGGEQERIADQKLQNHLAVQEPIESSELAPGKKGVFSLELLHEVFLNPGLFLLFGGIIIGFVGESQGPDVVKEDDSVFRNLFQGLLCLFLLEMGMTASRKLRDLGNAGWRFIAFGLIVPNVFATLGIVVAKLYSNLTHSPLQDGTYVIFAVLCGSASYIAVPAVQRLAIPEASPTLPLAASLGLTFSYNVTIGIPVYIQIAKIVTTSF
jgi:hypothetical protein